MSKYKLDTSILYELVSINLISVELNKLKLEREKEIQRQGSKKLSGIDYSKERVMGGLIESEEQQILTIQHLTQNIVYYEQMLNENKEALKQKKELIYSILTERQRYIFEETFIKGRTCESVADDLNVEITTILRERKCIVKAIQRIKDNIQRITSELFNNAM